MLRLAAFIAAIAAPAAAQSPPCAPTAAVYEMFSILDAKSRIATGSVGQAVVEWWVSESGSWSIIATLPTGVSCLIAGGENYAEWTGGREPNI